MAAVENTTSPEGRFVNTGVLLPQGLPYCTLSSTLYGSHVLVGHLRERRRARSRCHDLAIDHRLSGLDFEQYTEFVCERESPRLFVLRGPNDDLGFGVHLIRSQRQDLTLGTPAGDVSKRSRRTNMLWKMSTDSFELVSSKTPFLALVSLSIAI